MKNGIRDYLFLILTSLFITSCSSNMIKNESKMQSIQINKSEIDDICSKLDKNIKESMNSQVQQLDLKAICIKSFDESIENTENKPI